MKKRILYLLFPALLTLSYLLGPSLEEPKYDLELPVIENPEAFIQQREIVEIVKPDNEAQLIWRDSLKNKTEYVLLYLHGFTASKQEGNPVCQSFINRYECNAFVARLAEQGLESENPMLNYTAEGVWNSAKEALVVAQSMGQKVIIMSTSTGGTLALKLAAEYPGRIAGLINLSPNVRPRQWYSYLLNRPWGHQIAQTILGGNFRTIENQDDNYAKYWYDSYRIECLAQVQELVETTMTESTFSRVSCPVLNVFYFKDENNQDDVVDVNRIIWMNGLLGTDDSQKQLIPIENAQTHVIGCGLYSKAIPEVEEAIFNFSDDILNLNPVTLAN